MGKLYTDRWSRRDFTGAMALAGIGAYLGINPNPADALPPPEVTTIRLQKRAPACWVPQYLAEDLLYKEGFKKVEYIKTPGNAKNGEEYMHRGEIDFNLGFTGRQLKDVVPGNPTIFLSGLHTGCYMLIGSEKINSIRDLKGKKVWAGTMRSGPHIFFSAMVAYVGLNPNKDIQYIVVPPKKAIELFKKGEIDAFMSFPPAPQKLRDQGVGKVLIDTNVDKPWSQYFCCSITAQRGFTKKNPIATKRALRAILQSNAIVARDPEFATRTLIDMGIRKEAEYQAIVNSLREIPYGKWNEYNPEDTIRFYLLRLRDVGMTTYSPQEIIAQNTDWSFVKSMKDEFNLMW